MPSTALSFYRLPDLPRIERDADLASIIVTSVRQARIEPRDGDVFAIAQKIVSKAEGRVVKLHDVTPSPAAVELAKKADKDPRVVELILNESRRVVRHSPGIIIVEHRLGIVLANAGIDRSNIKDSEHSVLLLPENPDASAADLKQHLETQLGVRLGVMITDSVGRPWRLGTTGIAIGCAGMTALNDLRGQQDMFGRTLQVAEIATADCVAGAASLVMGEGAEGVPVVLVRGPGLVDIESADAGQTAQTILRPPDEDLFR